MKTWSEYPLKKVEITSKQYPALLKKITSPPKVLYYRGQLSKAIFKKSLAVVGSRRITRNGQLAVEQLVYPLAAAGVTIISGFMYGVDSAAHEQCLEAGGITVAVFGNGLNVIYPIENEKLYSRILNSGGLVVSEYPAETKPKLWTYPQRNRIVAGLSSLGVLVVEAGENSGSLITARMAKKQGKKVWAVPGPIFSSNSIGVNQLIQSGEAKMALGADDILGEKIKRKKEEVKLDLIEKEIYQVLQREPVDIDSLARLVEKSVSEVSQTLSLMSLRGLIIEINGQYFLSRG